MEAYGFLAVILLAALLQGITGFGSALIAAPLALLFLEKTTAIVALTFMSIALNAYLFWRVGGNIDTRRLRTLVLASVVGLPIGLFALHAFPVDMLRVLAGAFALFFAALLYRKEWKGIRSRASTLVAGFLSGMLHTSIGMSGPPVVLLLAGQNTEKNSARRTFAAFFLVISVVSVALFAGTGTLTAPGLSYGLLAMPATIVGAYAGALVAERVPQRAFKTLVFLLVAATGALALYTGLNP